MVYLNFRRVLISFIALIVISIATVTVYIVQDRKMISVNDNKAVAGPFTAITNDNSSKINIGLIGDSWVADQKLDKYIEAELESKAIHVKVISYGHPGAKSNQIYTNLMNKDSAFYSGSLLTYKHMKYIIVIAGVNDTSGHIGSDYYTHHMKEIVKAMNAYGKTPIILEVPEYGIEEPRPFKSTLKHNLYKLLFDNNKTDVINDYRDALKSSLNDSQFDYEIIPFDPVVDNYYKSIHLYKDPLHLNDKGNEVLGTYIGKKLKELIF